MPHTIYLNLHIYIYNLHICHIMHVYVIHTHIVYIYIYTQYYSSFSVFPESVLFLENMFRSQILPSELKLDQQFAAEFQVADDSWFIGGSTGSR